MIRALKYIVIFTLATNIACAGDIIFTPKNVHFVNYTYGRETVVEIDRILDVRGHTNLQSNYKYIKDDPSSRKEECFYFGFWGNVDNYKTVFNLNTSVVGQKTIVVKNYTNHFIKHNADLMKFLHEEKGPIADSSCIGEFYGYLSIKGIAKDGRIFNISIDLTYNLYGNNTVLFGEANSKQELIIDKNIEDAYLIVNTFVTGGEDAQFNEEWSTADPRDTSLDYVHWSGPR